MSYYKETIIREWTTQLGDSTVVCTVTPGGGRKVKIWGTYALDSVTIPLSIEDTRSLAALLNESADWELGAP